MSSTSHPTPRLYQRVAEQISAYMREHRLEPGQRLPSEKDLARKLNVSRPTIREAMIALEIAGQLEIRVGSGAYIRQAPNQVPLLLDAGPGPFELLRARLLIEGEIAADAALNASAEQLKQIEATIQEMKALDAAGQNAQITDRHFHVAIAEAARNNVLASIVDSLWAGIFSPIFHSLSHLAGLQHHQQMTLRDHQAIFTAIKARDPQAARAAMRNHLRHVEDILAGQPEKTARPKKSARKSAIRKPA
ncbi:FadR family transcriptional regulator [Terriglobus albidus]|uniref:FadR family transcriptional regulator n=1 Tax=Terriglobus albidus TaxID=1592106 RepID=A0A5B9ECZ2_9BACT|nr:FadR/GntR family transcriptional regulator [Terriglobus albidus]QEE30078.1 FadR family transcriptional regulator [Terriglobus albidus]